MGKEEKARDSFKETWVKTLMENMEKTVDPVTRERKKTLPVSADSTRALDHAGKIKTQYLFPHF